MIQMIRKKFAHVFQVVFLVMFFIGIGVGSEQVYAGITDFTENGVHYTDLGNGVVQDLDHCLQYKYDSKTKTYTLQFFLSGYKTEFDGNITIADKIKGKKVTAIGAYAFHSNSVIKEVTFGKYVKKIEQRAFNGCSNLTKVVLPSGLTTIGANVFMDCKALKSVTIPSSVTKIDVSAFENTGLERITLPAKVTSVCSRAFANCTNLYQLCVSKKLKDFSEQAVTGCRKDRLTIVAPKNSPVYTTFYENKTYAVTDSKELSFNIKSGLMLVGESRQIVALNCNEKLKWKSSKSSVAKISSTGLVTAKSSGTATLTATGTTKKFTIRIQVLPRTEDNAMRVITSEYVRPELSDYEKVVEANAWLVRNVKYDYSNFLAGTIPWSSYCSDGALEKGVAVCSGYANAFKKIMDYYSIPCQLTNSRSMNHAWNVVQIGGHWYHVDATWNDPIVNGSNGNTYVYTNYLLCSDRELRGHYGYGFSCNTSSRAKVNKTIKTASTASNARVKEVAVTPYLNAVKVTLAKGGDNFTLKIYGTKAKKFTSKNSKISSVSAKGVITAKKKGTTTVRVTGADGKTYSCVVKVEDPKISKTTLKLNVGASSTLKITGTGEKITWKSGNIKVATVSSKGKVKAVGAGRTSISATINGKKLTCTVTVHEHAYKSQVTSAATCEQDGVETYTCSCGKKYTQKIPAKGHDYQWVVTKQPSVTEETPEEDFGTRVLKCTQCGDIKQTEAIYN